MNKPRRPRGYFLKEGSTERIPDAGCLECKNCYAVPSIPSVWMECGHPKAKDG